jgi:ATP-dependent DNA helicase RecG
MEYIESYTTELKEMITPDIKKEIIAFANADGGEILVGITKQGKAIGVDNPESEMERISNMIRDGIKPDLTGFTTVSLIRDGNTNIIKITISRGIKRPYHLSDKGLRPSGTYIRHGVTSAPASDEMIRQMIKDSDGTTFDKLRSINQDLTFQYAESYFKNSKVPFEESNKRTLNLINDDGYYTNAALLLSDQCEHSIKCAVYRGIGKTNFQARNEFTGSILKQMDEAYQYVNLQNNQNSSIINLKREDHPDYPAYAIREALLNTIVHRDYDYSGSILINIFDDRIEFISIGGLVKGLTLMDIMGGVSQTRNTIIANVFYRLELIESYGTGIQRIIESYNENKYQPSFAPAPASFVVVLPNMNYIATDKVSISFSNEDKVLQILDSKEFITRRDIEKLLDCSAFPATKILTTLLKENRIERTGSARATKYVLKR